MYANLSVGIARQPVERNDHGVMLCDEEVAAYEVEVEGTTAIIKLDGQDSTGKYAEPAGERRIDLATHVISIAADF